MVRISEFIIMKYMQYQLVVDESVSSKAVDAFDAFAKKRELAYSDILHIRLAHKGIPDIKIINHLLNESTLFLTADRVAHNLALKKKLKSFYFCEGKISDALLPNITTKNISEVVHEDKLFDDSFLSNSATRNLVLPTGEKVLKSLTTKRRRIRNHFGGFDQLGEVAVTVSWEKFMGLRDRCLFGYQIKVISKNNMPAIMASENYFVDVAPDHLQNHTAMCYALIMVLRLSLQLLPVKVYFDVRQESNKIFAGYAHLPGEYQEFFELLKKEFTNVQFMGVDKGFSLLQARKKLLQLKNTPSTNELVYENIAEIRSKALAAVALAALAGQE